jgi:crotonobetainyl-CoA:carnitine CoA-transferase CaiB-like acyl-CoA transferase
VKENATKWSKMLANEREKGNPTMRTRTAVLENDDAERRKYMWAAFMTLIVALVLAAFVAAPRVFALAGPADDELLAANPELVYARAYSLGQNPATNVLAENPELVYAQAYSAGQTSASNVLAENPELVYAQAYSLGQSSGVAACVLDQGYASLAANPELIYLAQAEAC